MWNHKYSDSIYVDPNHTDLNQPIPEDSTNIGSIHESANIWEIEKIFTSTGHLVHTTPLILKSPIVLYGRASESLSPSHEFSSESVTPKGNPPTGNNPPNPVPDVSAEPDSYTGLLDYTSS